MTLRSAGRPLVLIVGADRATYALLEEWLVSDGIDVTRVPGDGQTEGGADPHRQGDIVLVDVAFPRDRGVELVQTVASEHPGMPIVVLSSGFFANVDCCGPCARQLGVAGVLPKPVAREALLAALRRLLPAPP